MSTICLTGNLLIIQKYSEKTDKMAKQGDSNNAIVVGATGTDHAELIGITRKEAEATSPKEEEENFNRLIHSLEKDSDFIIIDTPGSDNYLNRLAHSYADIVVTPINDSFIRKSRTWDAKERSVGC